MKKKHLSRKKIYEALRVGAELRMTSTVWKVESLDRLSATLSCGAFTPVTISTEELVAGILYGVFEFAGKEGAR